MRDYLTEKHEPKRQGVGSDPNGILLADILSLYAREVGQGHARPNETARRVTALLMFFGTKSLADLNGALCRSYADQHKSQSAARRELEDLRAAIRHFFADETFTPKVNIPMPDKSPARERWMTRSEAAKLLWTAWRKSIPVPKGKNGEVRFVSRHIARFILVGLYTGTRSAAICGAALKPTPGQGHVDLEQGVFYRRAPGSAQTTKLQPAARLPRRLLAHIRRWAAKDICRQYVVEWEGEAVQRVSKGFTSVVKAAGLVDVTPHILRHTSITWAMQNGAKIYDVAEYFGVSEKLIRSTYGHHHPDHQKGVTDTFDRRR